MTDKPTTARDAIRNWAIASLAALALLASAPDAQAGPKGTDRPIKGTCDTEVTPLSPPGDIPILLAVDVACHLSHLGLTGGGTDEEIVFPTGQPVDGLLPIAIFIRRITYIAANGDELWSTFAGSGAIDLIDYTANFEGVETFIGGTGRFRNAKGTSQTAGQASLLDNRGTLTLLGTISY